MNHRLMLSAAIAAILAVHTPAAAQQTVGPDASASQATSTSGAVANNAATNNNSTTNGAQTTTVAPINNGNSDSHSTADSGSLSLSNSAAQGGSSDSHANATGGTSSATTGASTATASNAASNAGNSQTTVFNSTSPNSVRTVPTVYAPALTTTLTETCMGSTTAGGSWLGGGISLGTTWEDKSCKRRLNARELAQTLGDREAARAVMCGDPDVADAYERLGRPCPKSPNYKSADAGLYIPQLPQPPAPPPPAPPVIVNVPAPAAAPPAVAQMAPIPNPPAPAYHPLHKRHHTNQRLKCPTGTDQSCQVEDDPDNGTVS